MKYTIELEDNSVRDLYGEGENYYQCKQMPYWYLPESLVNRLTPYTEPDRKAIEDEVWGFVNAIYGLSDEELYEIFYDGNYCEHSYQEAKARYEEWKRRKDEIYAGDEVYYVGDRQKKNVVTSTYSVGFDSIDSNGNLYINRNPAMWKI